MLTNLCKIISTNFFVLTAFIILICSDSNAQLDSVSLSSNFGYITIQDPDTSYQQKIITTQISISDFDFLGTILVTFYENDNNYPVDKQKYSRQELIDSGKWNQGVASIVSVYAEENRTYRIEVIASNYQGSYLDTIVEVLSAQ